jgi:hypothetical protein
MGRYPQRVWLCTPQPPHRGPLWTPTYTTSRASPVGPQGPTEGIWWYTMLWRRVYILPHGEDIHHNNHLVVVM